MLPLVACSHLQITLELSRISEYNALHTGTLLIHIWFGASNTPIREPLTHWRHSSHPSLPHKSRLSLRQRVQAGWGKTKPFYQQSKSLIQITYTFLYMRWQTTASTSNMQSAIFHHHFSSWAIPCRRYWMCVCVLCVDSTRWQIFFLPFNGFCFGKLTICRDILRAKLGDRNFACCARNTLRIEQSMPFY